MDWQQLIKERDEWVAHNFPNPQIPKPQESILGVIEEIGELSHAHLKGLQSIRGTQEQHDADAKDAIGDATVYLLGVLSHHQAIPTQTPPKIFISKLNSPQSCIFQAAKWAGQLEESILGVERRTSRVVAALRAYCLIRGWNYELIVTETWNKVKKRDWQKDPQSGGEVEPASTFDRQRFGGRI